MDHAARAKKALEGLIYSPKSGADAAGDIANGGASAAGAPADAALFSMLLEPQNATDEGAPKARPWERSDLVRRLRSFRPATWFCKPTPAGPIECARRGWVNTGQDLLSCEATTTFVAQLASEHAGDCPWRTAACAPELAAFPALPAETVHTEFAARCAALAALDQVPPIAPAALAAIAASHGPQLEALLADGPQQAQQRAGVGSEPPAQRSLDPEPETPAAPPPQIAGGGAAMVPLQQNGAVATPAQPGQADGSSLTGVLTDAAPAGSQEFTRRQRLLALLGWHAVPVPFGAAPAAEGRGGAASTDAGSPPPAQQASEDRLPAGQAVIFCRMCGAKHGLWSFLGAGGPDLSAARRPRPTAPSSAHDTPGSRGGVRGRPTQGSAATPASAPATLQANGSAGATPVAWRGFGSPQQPAGAGIGGNSAQGGGASSGGRHKAQQQLLGTTIAGGRLGGLTPGSGTKGGPFGSKGGPFGGGGTPSGGAAGVSAPSAPFGSSSKAAPVFGTPALAARTPRQPSAAAPAPAATIAGGVLSPDSTDGKTADAPAGAAATQQQQQQQQPSDAAGGSQPSPGGSVHAANGSVLSAPSVAPAAAAAGQGTSQQPAASPFGGGSTAPPVFGIAAMRSASFGTSHAGAAATPKRSREEADGAARPFCPWVQWHEAGGARRCGWSWCLDALVPKVADASAAGGAADAEGQPRDRASLVMSLLKRVGVRR